MLWSLLINGMRHSEIESATRPTPDKFGITARTAVQYEVVSAETDRILREFHEKLNSASDAVFSSCRLYRYALVRNWRGTGLFQDDNPRASQIVAFIGVNGSKADEKKPDRTVTRCINFAKSWGFGGYLMLNAFGYMETDPEIMKQQEDPNGPDNDAVLELGVKVADLTVAAWGVNASHLNRHQELVSRLPKIADIYCLGLTDGGMPTHPLYQRKDLEPKLWIPKYAA